MALNPPASVLEEYSDRFLILDFDHLFVTASLREEIWLIQRRDDPVLLRRVLADADSFFPWKDHGSGELQRLSGGQRVVLACLLMISLIREKGRLGTKILLKNVLESLSPKNQRLLKTEFQKLCASSASEVYVYSDETIRPVLFDESNRR